MKLIDAEKLKRLLEGLKKQAQRNCCDVWGIVPEALEEVEGFITSLQQEQPEVDLEKEAESYIIGLIGELKGYTDWTPRLKRFAKHFYELGLKARK